MYIRHLDLEVANLESIVESVSATQDATVALYNAWHDIKSSNGIAQRSLANLLSSSRTQRQFLEIKKRMKAEEAEAAFHKQGK